MSVRRTKLVKLRNHAYRKQQGHCYYCQFPMWSGTLDLKPSTVLRTVSQLQCTAEHLKARQDGGGDNQTNIVAACFKCNQARHRPRSPRDPNSHLRHVRRRIKKGKWHSANTYKLVADLT